MVRRGGFRSIRVGPKRVFSREINFGDPQYTHASGAEILSPAASTATILEIFPIALWEYAFGRTSRKALFSTRARVLRPRIRSSTLETPSAVMPKLTRLEGILTRCFR